MGSLESRDAHEVDLADPETRSHQIVFPTMGKRAAQLQMGARRKHAEIHISSYDIHEPGI